MITIEKALVIREPWIDLNLTKRGPLPEFTRL